MVASRRNAEKKEDRYDLFSSLLDASEDEMDGGGKLTDRELLGWPSHCYDATHTDGLRTQGISSYSYLQVSLLSQRYTYFRTDISICNRPRGMLYPCRLDTRHETF